ncbi:MAG: AAA family ATPase [Planctomycetaceae bacterium]|jgi:predicted ATPase|nr:AAA family ATPase [Phycisphaerales bacterium]MCE2654454.1 AAA family ATPase [Planctomycetaceae bacterium]
MAKPTAPTPARIEAISVKNYRALKNVEFKGLTPLTVLLGPNGSGKSTVFDVFAFLSECFAGGLRKAWDKRGRFKELRSRGADGPIEIEIQYREGGRPTSGQRNPLITYHLAVGEEKSGPVVVEEWLRWRRTGTNSGQPFYFLRFARGKGDVIEGESPNDDGEREAQELDSPDLLAVSTLGQFAKHPRVSSLRRFISGWYLSYLTADHTRGVPEAGPQEKLSPTGDNLPNVIQFLEEQHPDRLKAIRETLARRIPRLESVEADLMGDGRLLLKIKDAPFTQPVLAKWASDGTLKMLAYLLVLHDPKPSPLVGIEEPENHLHPKLLTELAEECLEASESTQLMVTTHSPFFVNALQPRNVWVLSRGTDGYTLAHNTEKLRGVSEMVEAGAQLGYLWMENHFGVGDPLQDIAAKTGRSRKGGA